MIERPTSTDQSPHWARWLPLLPAACALVIVALLLVGPPLTPWSYDPVTGSRIIVGLVAMGLIALSLLGPVFQQVSPARRATLSAFRLGVVVLVVVFLLQPTCERVEIKPQSAALLILLDQSRSMQLPHETGGKTRWQMQREILQQNEPLLRELAKDLTVKVYGYDAKLHEIKFSDGAISLPETPDGGQTDIGSPLSEAVAGERSQRLAGVILLGDGVQTAFDPRVEIYQAALQLDDLQQPLYTVVFGSESDAAQSADVAVENLPDQYSVFVKNELLVRGQVRVRGFVNQEIPVQLIVTDNDGQETVVDTRRLKVLKDGQQFDVEMTYSPQQAGKFQLSLRAAAQPDEELTKNNELTAFLTVFEGGLRVLYLEGDLRLEQKFLRRSIDASQDIELDFQWIDHRRRASWPVNLVDVLKDPKYDVFIIGDLDSSALYKEGVQEDNLNALVAAVDRGKGLMMLGGYHSFGPGRYHATPLADILPIKMEKFEAQDFDAKISTSLHVNRPLQMLPTEPHFLTHLAPGGQNLQAWRSLPPLDGANKFAGIKDRAIVRAESPDGVPLLVSDELGGRVLAFAGDSTWRWWMQGHQDEHRRFWRQVVLWLAKRDELTQDDVWIKLPQRRFNPGSDVEFNVGARTSAGDVISDARFSAELQAPAAADDKPQRTTLSLSRDGVQEKGKIPKTATVRPGTYTVEVTARDAAGRVLGTSQAQFMVFDHDLEKSIAAADPAQLARLAEITSKWGGRAVAPEEFSKLLEEIKRRPPELKIEVPHRWQIADTWRDAWLFFLLVVTLLTFEWVFRKKWGLV